jgi:hypothetical protein
MATRSTPPRRQGAFTLSGRALTGSGPVDAARPGPSSPGQNGSWGEKDARSARVDRGHTPLIAVWDSKHRRSVAGQGTSITRAVSRAAIRSSS